MIKKHYIYNKVAATLLAATLTSCGDFLDTIPMNEIVQQNYWTKKLDATQSLDACYTSLASYDNIARMALWGELRSENVLQQSGGNDEESRAIGDPLKEDMQTTNALAKWDPIYKTINYCNVFIHNAPNVAAIDPNYPESELKRDIAEATAIRDLCYFYLLRAFHAVPISFEPSLDDEQEYQIAPDSIMPGLDKLIADLQAVENDAVKRYYNITQYDNTEVHNNHPDAKKNSARITRSAIYAILADMNLWRGNYDEVIRYCDLIIDYKNEIYNERIAYKGEEVFNDMVKLEGVPLIRERLKGKTKDGNSYKEIFGWGNSVESILELCYNAGGKGNDFVNKFYSNNIYRVPNFLAEGVLKGENPLFTVDDCRVYETINHVDEKTNPTINKYVYSEMSDFDITKYDPSSNQSWVKGTGRNSNPNWIIYRLTDIMLMKAEALIEKGSENYAEAFKLINAVYYRGHSLLKNLDATKYTAQTSLETMRDLLFDERQRELMFEGKRWFDLVRRSIREGNSNYLAKKAVEKQTTNRPAIETKLQEFNKIFLPIFKEELKLNKYLKQNPAYGNTEDFVQ